MDANVGANSELLPDENMPKYAMGGAIVTIIGSVLPWVSVLGVSAYGFEFTEGKLTLLAGIAILAALYYRPWDEQTALGTVAVGALVTLITIGNISDFTAAGLYVTLLGGVVVLVAGGLGYHR